MFEFSRSHLHKHTNANIHSIQVSDHWPHHVSVMLSKTAREVIQIGQGEDRHLSELLASLSGTNSNITSGFGSMSLEILK